MGNWAELPWIGIFNPQITKTAQSGYYIVYLFREDMQGVYLSLNQGVTEIRNKYGDKIALNNLANTSQSFREKLYLKPDLSDELEEDISLGTGNYAPFYEAGNIYAKYYPADDLPNDVVLIEDLNEFETIYKHLSVNSDLILVQNETEIREVQNKFIESLVELSDEKFLIKVGFPGGQNEAKETYWSNELGMWTQPVEIEGNRFWNGFGLTKPDPAKSSNIICEINFPFKGIKRIVAGAIAKDSNNNYYILHRGNLGGKYSKKDFIEKYKGEWAYVEDGDRKTKMALIGKLDDPNLPYKVRDFVHEIFKIKYGDDEIPKDDLEDISGSGVNFYELLSKKGYFYPVETIENYLLSLKVKPFVILTGNSGTGKTKLAQLYAQYLPKNNYRVIPVGANWTENRHIVGFYNLITEKYQITPALELILDSKKLENSNLPYFLILDEMNLSHVERYFADFLSALESGETIPLHNQEEDEIVTELKIPNNLMVVGTVNVDETTYMFSPKVLDRANTLEFETYSAQSYMQDKADKKPPKGDWRYLENPLEDLEVRDYDINQLRKCLKNIQTPSGDELWLILGEELEKFQKTLKKAGFDFGFRVVNEILRFMYVAWKYENEPYKWDNWERYFDAQIKQKMLPKLHGSERVLGEVIQELKELCKENQDRIRFSTSYKKLEEMEKVLFEQRYVSFIN